MAFVKYFGGKYYIAKHIIRYFPPHRHYVEVFMGGASVFFAKKKAGANTLNDINSDIVNLYVQVRDNCDAFMEKLFWMVNSRELYRRVKKDLKENKLTDLERAVWMYYKIEASYAGKATNGAGWAYAITEKVKHLTWSKMETLKDIRAFLENTQIECLDFREFIPKYDWQHTLFYCDPPYYGIEGYEHSFTKQDHIDLCNILSSIKGKFVLSCNDSIEIRGLYSNYYIVELKNCRYGDSKEIGQQVSRKTELLIMNYLPEGEQLDLLRGE